MTIMVSVTTVTSAHSHGGERSGCYVQYCLVPGSCNAVFSAYLH